MQEIPGGHGAHQANRYRLNHRGRIGRAGRRWDFGSVGHGAETTAGVDYRMGTLAKPVDPASPRQVVARQNHRAENPNRNADVNNTGPRRSNFNHLRYPRLIYHQSVLIPNQDRLVKQPRNPNFPPRPEEA